MSHLIASAWCARSRAFSMSIVLLFMLSLSACGSAPQTQQYANQDKIQLDQAIKNAQGVGVPGALLKPILAQENALNRTSQPLALFSTQNVHDYYANLSQRYRMLTVQMQGLQTQVTQQLDYQAALDMQTFGTLLSQRRSENIVVPKSFSNQLQQNHSLLVQAQYPRQYLQISQHARAAIAALRLLGPVNDKLKQLQTVTKQLQSSHLDTTALQQQQAYDLVQFGSASSATDYSNLMNQIDAQLLETTTLSIQAIPYVGAAKLNELSSSIGLMKLYGINTSSYQQHFDTDKLALDQAKSVDDFLKVAAQIDADNNAIQFPLLKARAGYLLDQYHQEVKIWGDAHQYIDKFSGTTYRMGYEYDENGIGSDLDAAVQTAVTRDDYQAAIDEINATMTNMKAMEADTSDPTPWSQPHQTDTQLLQYYNVMNKQVIVVSLVEQTLRLYQNGQLLRAFQITSGQYDKPSVPGFWTIMDRESPTVFKSSEPKGSAFWYPDTNINFAMLYHAGGYFFHDSWWRVEYGPGTQFPHYDSGGDESFAGTGSHGCVNMPEDQAGWLYRNTSYDTVAIIY